MIAEGPVSTDRGRLALYVPLEFTEPISAPRSKQGCEWAHLAAARHDLQRGGDRSLDGTPRFGVDPPDFVVDDNVRVELAQYTDSSRRSALAMFSSVRQAAIEASSDRFHHLRGRLILLAFEHPRGLPPRRFDNEAIQAVLNQLDKVNAGPDPVPVDDAAAQDGFSVAIHNIPLGESAIAVFPLPMTPNTSLGNSRGFELAACVTIATLSRDIETELKRIVQVHDEASNEVLVISAGAPDRSGLCLIADEVALEEHMLRRIALPQPDHLKRVLLHRWSFGDVFELFPTYRLLAEPRSRDNGGPFTVPVVRIADETWTGPCPCGTGTFVSCHGVPTVNR